ncbi:AAA family ATPase [Paraburkholderia kirstenboschensis]|uniref:AAA family ATPase n=1 Tax=Paraburkholderia kirstenboschensis TaxID=1245436 RepID=UPI000B1DCC94|nr:AAA family ATPase [Paraburkholderia kirstenboschensis]
MRLIKFSAANVFRSYNFSIDFNPDLNFLVGINGSGKTTALRLIQAALTVNVRELWTISFREMEIQFEKDAKICTLTISKNKLEIEFRVIELAGVSSIRIYEKDELEQYTKTGKIDEMAEEIRFRFLREKNLISEFMASIPEPMFIGLERRLKTNDELYDEETFRFHITNGTRVAPARHRNAPGEEGIENARRLIKNEYRKYRRIADAANSSLVNVIVRSTFKYIGIDDSLRADKSKRYAEYRNIISRRREIEQVASELGGTSNAKNQIDLFLINWNRHTKLATSPTGPRCWNGC